MIASSIHLNSTSDKVYRLGSSSSGGFYDVVNKKVILSFRDTINLEKNTSFLMVHDLEERKLVNPDYLFDKDNREESNFVISNDYNKFAFLTLKNKIYSIVIGDFNNDYELSEEEEIVLNNCDHVAGFTFGSNSNELIISASPNDKTNNYGETDLYFMRKKELSWDKTLINLGENVNSPNMEITPTYIRNYGLDFIIFSSLNENRVVPFYCWYDGEAYNDKNEIGISDFNVVGLFIFNEENKQKFMYSSNNGRTIYENNSDFNTYVGVMNLLPERKLMIEGIIYDENNKALSDGSVLFEFTNGSGKFGISANQEGYYGHIVDFNENITSVNLKASSLNTFTKEIDLDLTFKKNDLFQTVKQDFILSSEITASLSSDDSELANGNNMPSSQSLKIPFGYDMYKIEYEELDESMKEFIENEAYKLEYNPELKLTIIGYSDNLGNRNYNYKISKQRAGTVAQFFFDRGVKKSQIEIIGKGPENPIVEDCDNEEDCAPNRRVVFKKNNKN